MHRSVSRLLLLIASSALFAGCAASAASTGALHNVVRSEDLARAGDVDLYDALQRVRPTFLRARGMAGTASQSQPIQVYIGRMRMEGLEHLREIRARSVEEVQQLEPAQANARFGGNNSAGALVIVLKP